MPHVRTPRRLTAAASVGALALALAACGGSDSGGQESVQLRLSHQWPAPTGEGSGDFRAVLAQKFADRVAKETNDSVEVTVAPNSSLVEPEEQYQAMKQGAIDMSVYPLDYASGQVPEFSITLMPTMPRSHDEAQAWEDAEIGKRIDEITQENGVRVLTWVWNAGAVGSKGEPITNPDDVKSGMKMRAAGSYVEEMLKEAGAGITSLPSSEIYNAMQTGVLDAAVTSTGSFSSYKLQEQVDSYTSPTDNTFWFMFEPLLISNSAWEKLSPEQQKTVEKVGADLQKWAYDAAEKDDMRVEKEFEEAGVNVQQMSDEDFAAWQDIAAKVHEDFASDVPQGQELLDLAKQASQG
jgi:TRAP-type C4-dicarboxylate transport system substrate-binding protein